MKSPIVNVREPSQFRKIVKVTTRNASHLRYVFIPIQANYLLRQSSFITQLTPNWVKLTLSVKTILQSESKLKIFMTNIQKNKNYKNCTNHPHRNNHASQNRLIAQNRVCDIRPSLDPLRRSGSGDCRRSRSPHQSKLRPSSSSRFRYSKHQYEKHSPSSKPPSIKPPR